MMLNRRTSVVWLLGALLCSQAVACSDNSNGGANGVGGTAGSTGSGGTAVGGGGSSGTGGSGGNRADSSAPSDATTPNYTYTLVDDMETTTHGPIEFTGVSPPLSPGYWFNFGAGAAGDTATPPIMSFAFTMISSPNTIMGKMSTTAAHQACSLNMQYEPCGIGFEFAQVPLPDAGTNAGVGPADASPDALATADAGPPMMTVPFDISAYKGIAFWGRAEVDSGTLDVKVQFPDTDTDPRGVVCNGPPAGVGTPTMTQLCFNSYAVHVKFTSEWQQFVVLFKDLAIDPLFGFMHPAPFTDTDAGAGQIIGSEKVYGVNWQGQKNSIDDAGAVGMDFWVDDVYFVQ
jgi:hypothetical protein